MSERARTVEARLALSDSKSNIRKQRREQTRKLLARIVPIAARLEAIPEERLFSSCKVQEVAECRWAVMLVARERGHSLLNIGFALKLDHTTVMYGLQAAERLVANDPGYAALVGCLRAEADNA